MYGEEEVSLCWFKDVYMNPGLQETEADLNHTRTQAQSFQWQRRV